VSRSLVRAAAAALLGAVLAAAWLLFFYAARPSLRIEFDVTPPDQVTGIYTAEFDPASELTFVWTAEVLTIRLPGLDRQTGWTFEMRARAARPDPATNPELAIFADGSPLLTTPASSGFADITVPIPPRPERVGLTLSVRSSATMIPGPRDRRALGVMLDRITIAPSGIVVPPRRAFAAVAIATAFASAAMVLLGVTSVMAVAATLVFGGGIALLMATGFGPYTEYPGVIARLSLLVWLSTLGISAGVRLIRRRAFTGTAIFVIVFSACAVVLKLAVLMHPGMPIGDAMFHAHRFHDVLSGKLYFTSIAPGNYAFPYAPGLYVLAKPLSGLVRRGPADMALLRTIVIAFDAVAGALLYLAIVRAGDRHEMRVAGAFAVALYHHVPLAYRITTVGNLTNAFAQSLAVISLALIAAPVSSARQVGYFAMVTAFLAFAFLSHTSTFAIGTVAVGVIAILFYVRGGPQLRRIAVAVGLSVAVASLAAIAVYYSHFIDTYRTEWGRIRVETATAAPDAGGREITTRLISVPRYLLIYFGPPVLALAAWGTVVGWRRLGRSPLMLAVSGWLLACLFFLVIGIVTPVDMRHYLAAIPALAIAAGIGAADGWFAGGTRRATSVALLAAAIAIGLFTWWNTI
jgi:hypothetical protein